MELAVVALAVIAALAVLAAAYHRRNLRALIRWLDAGDTPDAPRAYGAWDRLHALIHRFRRDSARREAELAHAVRRWQDAARALPEGVVILDEQRISWANDAARVHLDIDPAKDEGRPITHLVRIPAFAEYLAAGNFTKPIMVETPDQRFISMQLVPYGESQGLILSRDVTQFQKVERMRREFVANVSHELRTPLTVVSGFIETLRDERDPEAARRFLGLMGEQADRMQRLVEDLLTLSALESAPPPPIEERVHMAAVLERLGAEARALSNGRHRIVLEPAAPWELSGSEKELESAFGNLVSNAIRYTPEGGTVTLRWKATDEGAAFEVQDTGIGVAPEHLPRLTERFYRVDRGRSRETGGTGLGLAIVKHALVRHGASLNVSSQPGVGSTFTARFSGPRLRLSNDHEIEST